MHTCSEARSSLLSLLRGVEHFNSEIFPGKETLFSDLASGQSPGALFIACADSRIQPNLITHTEPGDLFILRNIGNIVPAYGEMLGGVSSAIEYAVLGLGVSSIIICGHSDCGAMKALLPSQKSNLEKMPTVASWLRNAEAARAAALSDFSAEDVGPATIRTLAEHNVLLQLAHLRTHPAVAAGLARNTLFLQGWFYDIGSGEVSILDERTRHTVSVAEAIQQITQPAS